MILIISNRITNYCQLLWTALVLVV